jgi:antitoxin CcdA
MRMGTKKAVNLSVDAALVSEARELGLNLSAELETRLAERVKAARWARWQEENREAIEANNRQLSEDGLWSDGLRQF